MDFAYGVYKLSYVMLSCGESSFKHHRQQKLG